MGLLLWELPGLLPCHGGQGEVDRDRQLQSQSPLGGLGV